jgi:hypothetical protein
MMKRRTIPADWQIDGFVRGMIAVLVAIMRAHISPSCEIFVDTGRATLLIAGMSVCVCANRAARCEEDRQQRSN